LLMHFLLMHFVFVSTLLNNDSTFVKAMSGLQINKKR